MPMFDINSNLLRLLAATFSALILGTFTRMVVLRHANPELREKRMGSLKVWWSLTILMSLAVVFGRYGTAVLLAAAGILGLNEFLKLIDKNRIGKPAVAVAFSSVPLQYALITTGHDLEARYLLPVLALLAVSTVRLLQGNTECFTRTTAGTYWGIMLLVYCVSHAVMLFNLPATTQPTVGMAGWFLYVIIITEMDDIAQAITGRLIGRHKITPTISPNKTWEGFAGGVITSVVLSVVLAPWLTTFPSAGSAKGLLVSVAAGLLLVTAAFLGDINMSAIKRDVGVKDGSSILPGMGGIIDRIDSLTFTAPAFYYFLCCVL